MADESVGQHTLRLCPAAVRHPPNLCNLIDHRQTICSSPDNKQFHHRILVYLLGVTKAKNTVHVTVLNV
jgi:hypothetical protein